VTEFVETRSVRLATALGTLVLALPTGEELVADPGVSDGEMLAWTPAPALGGFSVSHGPSLGRSADELEMLERALATQVTVEADEVNHDFRELRLLVESHRPRASVRLPSGERSGTAESIRREHVRFRFWQSGDNAVRAGYRLDEAAPAALRSALDRITDSVRLEDA
jgi:hypothetical protein